MTVAVLRNGSMECHTPVWKLSGKMRGEGGRRGEEVGGHFYSSWDRRVAVGTPHSQLNQNQNGPFVTLLGSHLPV